MSDGTVTDTIGRVWGASGQRWALVALALVAAEGATASTGLAAGYLPLAYMALVALPSVVALVKPDSPVALVTVAAVVLWWFADADEVGSPWALATATGLLVFHLVVALMAVTPPNAIVAPAVLHRWLRRGVAVLAATVAVWGGVALLDGRSVPGSVALVLAALVALTAVVVAGGVRSTARAGQP